MLHAPTSAASSSAARERIERDMGTSFEIYRNGSHKVYDRMKDRGSRNIAPSWRVYRDDKNDHKLMTLAAQK
jgi:hypothetical protein